MIIVPRIIGSEAPTLTFYNLIIILILILNPLVFLVAGIGLFSLKVVELLVIFLLILLHFLLFT